MAFVSASDAGRCFKPLPSARLVFAAGLPLRIDAGRAFTLC